MVKTLNAERRKALRATRILSIQYKLHKGRNPDTDKEWHLSTTHDMSYLGLAFLSEVPYNMNDTLEIHVIMSGVLDIFRGYGKVIRIERKSTGAYYLIAIKFVDNIKPKTTRKKATKTVKNRINKTAAKRK